MDYVRTLAALSSSAEAQCSRSTSIFAVSLFRAPPFVRPAPWMPWRALLKSFKCQSGLCCDCLWVFVRIESPVQVRVAEYLYNLDLGQLIINKFLGSVLSPARSGVVFLLIDECVFLGLCFLFLLPHISRVLKSMKDQ